MVGRIREHRHGKTQNTSSRAKISTIISGKLSFVFQVHLVLTDLVDKIQGMLHRGDVVRMASCAHHVDLTSYVAGFLKDRQALGSPIPGYSNIKRFGVERAVSI